MRDQTLRIAGEGLYPESARRIAAEAARIAPPAGASTSRSRAAAPPRSGIRRPAARPSRRSPPNRPCASTPQRRSEGRLLPRPRRGRGPRPRLPAGPIEVAGHDDPPGTVPRPPRRRRGTRQAEALGETGRQAEKPAPKPADTPRCPIPACRSGAPPRSSITAQGRHPAGPDRRRAGGGRRRPPGGRLRPALVRPLVLILASVAWRASSPRS